MCYYCVLVWVILAADLGQHTAAFPEPLCFAIIRAVPKSLVGSRQTGRPRVGHAHPWLMIIMIGINTTQPGF